MCRGGYAGDPCTEHDQCSGNYYCGKIESEGLTWSMCIPAKGLKENCTQDYECQNHMVCTKDKDFRNNKIQQCHLRWSQPEGTYTGDYRQCKSGVTTSSGYCSNVVETYQTPISTNSSSNRCDVNVNKGMCHAVLSYDKSITSDFIVCQCSLVNRNQSFCRWPGLNSQIKLFSQALNIYQKSYTCPRSLLPDDPLNLDFLSLKQCTQAT